MLSHIVISTLPVMWHLPLKHHDFCFNSRMSCTMQRVW